jgi:hypothetical protein
LPMNLADDCGTAVVKTEEMIDRRQMNRRCLMILY